MPARPQGGRDRRSRCWWLAHLGATGDSQAVSLPLEAVTAADPGSADAAYPPGLRRTTTTTTTGSTRISLAGEEGETVVDALRQAFHDAARLGLGLV